MTLVPGADTRRGESRSRLNGSPGALLVAASATGGLTLATRAHRRARVLEARVHVVRAKQERIARLFQLSRLLNWESAERHASDLCFDPSVS